MSTRSRRHQGEKPPPTVAIPLSTPQPGGARTVLWRCAQCPKLYHVNKGHYRNVWRHFDKFHGTGHMSAFFQEAWREASAQIDAAADAAASRLTPMVSVQNRRDNAVEKHHLAAINIELSRPAPPIKCNTQGLLEKLRQQLLEVPVVKTEIDPIAGMTPDELHVDDPTTSSSSSSNAMHPVNAKTPSGTPPDRVTRLLIEWMAEQSIKQSAVLSPKFDEFLRAAQTETDYKVPESEELFAAVLSVTTVKLKR